jgi:Na+/melibiose symporter-like transporter
MAISSTLCGAVLVENGQRLQASDAFVSQQWLWFNIAAMASAFIGGELVERLTPAGALHTAAAIVAFAPLAAIFGALFLIEEASSRLDFAEMKQTFRGLLAAFTFRDLWLIGLFLFLYYLNPGFGTPLYYHMTDRLKFSQDYIGILGAINSAGWIVGALFYRKLLKGMSSRRLLIFSIALGTVTTAAFLLLWNEAAAAFINFFSGAAGLIAFVATLTLAADLSEAGRRVRLCRLDVVAQFVIGSVRQYRLVSVRTSVPPPSRPADPGFCGVDSANPRPGSAVAAGRQGARHTSPLNAHRKNVKGFSIAVCSLCGKS